MFIAAAAFTLTRGSILSPELLRSLCLSVAQQLFGADGLSLVMCNQIYSTTSTALWEGQASSTAEQTEAAAMQAKL